MVTKAPAAWTGLETPALDREAARALLDDRVAYVRVPRFLAPERCRVLARRFLEGRVYETKRYGSATTYELGAMLASMIETPDDYFSMAAKASARLREFYADGEDPYLLVRRRLTKALGWTAPALVQDKRPYLTDFIWAFPPGTAAGLHHDIFRDVPSLAIERFSRQWSWNVYLAVADRGGEFRIYRRRFKDEDEARRTPEYTYVSETVEGAPRAVCRLEPGDFILFDSSYYHEVTRVEGEACRVASHSFVGLDERRKRLGFWI